MQAMKNKESHAKFQGQNIKLAPTMAFMSTMNPSFAVMSALPDNLQSQMWPVALAQPDAALIAESVLLCSGFQNCKARRSNAILLLHSCGSCNDYAGNHSNAAGLTAAAYVL